VLQMFGLNGFRIRTKSLVFAIMKYHVRGNQLVACLIIYVSQTYFYVSRNNGRVLHRFFCDVASKISYN
jgi:hypothetical protein